MSLLRAARIDLPESDLERLASGMGDATDRFAVALREHKVSINEIFQSAAYSQWLAEMKSLVRPYRQNEEVQG